MPSPPLRQRCLQAPHHDGLAVVDPTPEDEAALEATQEKLDRSQAVLGPFFCQIILEYGVFKSRQESGLAHLPADLFCKNEGVLLKPIVIFLRQGNGIFQRIFNAQTEQPLNTAGEHAAPDKVQKNRRDERKADKGKNKFSPEAGAQHAVFSLDRELPEAPAEHEDNNGKEQEVRTHEQEYENVIGNRASKPPVLELQHYSKCG